MKREVVPSGYRTGLFIVVLLLSHLVLATPAGDLFIFPRLGPKNSAVPNYVMRPTAKIPIADGRPERDCFSVKRQFPIRRRKRSDYLLATPAAATVRRRRVIHGDINYARARAAQECSERNGAQVCRDATFNDLRLTTCSRLSCMCCGVHVQISVKVFEFFPLDDRHDCIKGVQVRDLNVGGIDVLLSAIGKRNSALMHMFSFVWSAGGDSENAAEACRQRVRAPCQRQRTKRRVPPAFARRAFWPRPRPCR